ncbi:MAG: superoxide dismutase family protein [Clostridia bacterium]|nr:superoxide dismutase family protein [Clostridia bacterium]
MNRLPSRPDAAAILHGGPAAPDLTGAVRFYQLPAGVLVVADLTNLPPGGSGFFGFHLHEGADCAGEDFSSTGGHYNPAGLPHPQHAGDLPPLLRFGEGAYLAVMTDRFGVDEIIGRTAVIHGGTDDFTTQPAGNAGAKIACGVIRRL